MKSANETVLLELGFPDRRQAQPLLERIASIPHLLLNIVRGRVTAEEARFEVEVTGTTSRVDRALRITRESGIEVRRIPACA